MVALHSRKDELVALLCTQSSGELRKVIASPNTALEYQSSATAPVRIQTVI
jgi:hypothetical protein